MPDSEKTAEKQKIIATGGSHIENVNQMDIDNRILIIQNTNNNTNVNIQNNNSTSNINNRYYSSNNKKSDGNSVKYLDFFALILIAMIFIVALSIPSNITDHSASDRSDDLASNLPISEPSAPPVADFSADLTLGNAPLEVKFTDLSKNATEYSWNFGDGFITANKESPDHVYKKAGNYTVILTVENAKGKDKEIKKAI